MKNIIHSQEGINEAFEKLSMNGENSLIALDIETDWFDEEHWSPLQLGLEGIGLYDGMNKYFIVYKSDLDYSGLDLLVHTFPIVGHNIKFDLQVLLNVGLITEIDSITISDTKILSFIDNENEETHLKTLAKTILGREPVTLQQVGRKPGEVIDMFGFNQEKINERYRVLGEYCIDDCINTYDLYNYFIDKLGKDSKLVQIHNKLEMPFLKVLLNMEKVGITIDEEYMNELAEKINKILIEIQVGIFKIVGREFNIASVLQLQEVLEELKIQIPEDCKTPKGKPSTGNKTLEFLSNSGIELGTLLLQYREYAKLESNFTVGIKSKMIDGVVHSQFNHIGTVTGRLSSSVPNLQQIPRREDKFNIRKAFIPRKGNQFVICDISQAELRMLAFFSKEPLLVSAFKNGEDVHQKTADKLGITRNEAKAVNFGLLYGQTSYGLAENLGITRVDAQKIITNYFNEMPYVKTFIDKCYETVCVNKFIPTILGRRRHFPDYKKVTGKKSEDFKRDSSLERQIVNSRIQGSIGDFMKIAMRDIQKEVSQYNGNILVQIHDEIIVECPSEHSEKVLEIVTRIMSSAISLGDIPIIAEGKICNQWEK